MTEAVHLVFDLHPVAQIDVSQRQDVTVYRGPHAVEERLHPALLFDSGLKLFNESVMLVGEDGPLPLYVTAAALCVTPFGCEFCAAGVNLNHAQG
jgi:hypothetical protein